MSVKQITVGQDSFLDIVANLVGVLIILVVVVGAQATSAWQADAKKTDSSQIDQNKSNPSQIDPAQSIAALDAEIQTAKTELEVAHDRVRKMEIDNRLLEDQIVQQADVMVDLASQRHHMLVQTQIVEQELEKRREETRLQQQRLTQEQQTRLDLQQRERKLESELLAIESEAAAVAAAAAPPKSEVIDHYPNPIAKTVFSEEVHFQLRGGKLSYVPLEELISRMKSEWKVKSEKLKTAHRTMETVGPIGNFRLQYELDTETVSQLTQFGEIQRQAVRFDGFTILPSSENLGDPVSDALRENSEFTQVLGRYPQGKTTVSIWIYPDSYAAYNELKGWLYQHDYKIAVWPLEAGARISGGPNGFRTSAQ